jgi:hypothetical protein
MSVHHSGPWDRSLDRHLGGLSLVARERVFYLLITIGDLKIFVKADDRRGGYGRHGGMMMVQVDE